MEINVFIGEWINALQNRMMNAMDGDCFCLPTDMHLHAFMLLKQEVFANRDFKVKITPAAKAQ